MKDIFVQVFTVNIQFGFFASSVKMINFYYLFAIDMLQAESRI